MEVVVWHRTLVPVHGVTVGHDATKRSVAHHATIMGGACIQGYVNVGVATGEDAVINVSCL